MTEAPKTSALASAPSPMRRHRFVQAACLFSAVSHVAATLICVYTFREGNFAYFSPQKLMQFVPEHLADCVMPYDDRLESVRNYAGTRSDFAQRALRHFVEALGAASLPLDEARATVSAALASRPQRLQSVGKRMSDDEIRRVLTEQWSQHGGSCTRLLRYLRDEARISCEQKRFSRIWNALAAELRT